MADVFVSYSTHDSELASHLVSCLEQDGLMAWIAPRDIAPGSDWASAIHKALADCRALVLLFTPAASDSRQVARELSMASDLEMPIFPIRTDTSQGTLDGSFAYHLAGTQWIEAPSGDAISQAAKDITKMLLSHGAPEDAAKPLAAQQSAARQSRRISYSTLVDLGINLSYYVAAAQLPASGRDSMRAGLLPKIAEAVDALTDSSTQIAALSEEMTALDRGHGELAKLSWYPERHTPEQAWIEASYILVPISLKLGQNDEVESLLAIMKASIIMTDLAEAESRELMRQLASDASPGEDPKKFLMTAAARMHKAARSGSA